MADIKDVIANIEQVYGSNNSLNLLNKTPDDIRPGTRKGKIDQEPVWMIKIIMPKKLMNDINRGYTELDKNKIEDIVSASGVNAQIDPAEQQAQEMANAQPAPAA